VTARAYIEIPQVLPEVNRDLFKRIRDRIREHPEWHDNWGWERTDPECGTTRCVAGWAIHFQNPTQDIGETQRQLGYRRYSQAGRDLLGLTKEEAEYLFYNDNEEAMAMVEHFAENGREDWVFPEESW